MVQEQIWKLRLYVIDKTPKTLIAFSNLQDVCEEELKGKYEVEVIDLLENPEVASDQQILATPTLVKQSPLPIRRVIGDLSNKERLISALDLKEGKNLKLNSNKQKNASLRSNYYGSN